MVARWAINSAMSNFANPGRMGEGPDLQREMATLCYPSGSANTLSAKKIWRAGRVLRWRRNKDWKDHPDIRMEFRLIGPYSHFFLFRAGLQLANEQASNNTFLSAQLPIQLRPEN